MKALIYARFSDELSNCHSADDQIDAVSARLKADGHDILEAFKDEAISGTTTHRPGLQAMLGRVAMGGVDMIAAESLDRISRELADVATIYRNMTFQNVVIWTMEEGFIEDMHVAFKGAMSNAFIKQLKEKIRRGHFGQLSRGKNPAGKPYGYDAIPKVLEDGTIEKGHLVINEAEAEVVRRIFRMYVAGASTKHIAAALNKDGIPAQKGGEWRASAISGNKARRVGILWNELYAGVRVYNRISMIRNPHTGKRISRPNPESEWRRENFPHLRIIDPALYDQAVARRDASSNNYPLHQRRRPKTVLQNLVYCGCCGGRMVQKGGNYMACSRARDAGTCDNTRSVRRDHLEARVFARLSDWLQDSEMVQEFIREFHRTMDDLARNQNKHRDTLAATIQRLDAELARLVNVIASGLDSPAIHRQIMDKEQKRKEAEREMSLIGKDNVARLHPNAAKIYARNVQKLDDALRCESDSPDRLEAFNIARSLVERVVVTPAGDKDHSIEIEGALAGALNLMREDTDRSCAMDGSRGALPIIAQYRKTAIKLRA